VTEHTDGRTEKTATQDCTADQICKYCARVCTTVRGTHIHEARCSANPNRPVRPTREAGEQSKQGRPRRAISALRRDLLAALRAEVRRVQQQISALEGGEL